MQIAGENKSSIKFPSHMIFSLNVYLQIEKMILGQSAFFVLLKEQKFQFIS